MRKRALKKRREELRELLADRREALGELVLGMHIQEVWDDGLLARGAAEVREVEDGLAALDEEGEVPAAEAEIADSGEEPAAEGAPAAHPEFETAEHTMEHRLPPETAVKPETDGDSVGESEEKPAIEEPAAPPEALPEPPKPTEAEAGSARSAGEARESETVESKPTPQPVPGVAPEALRSAPGEPTAATPAPVTKAPPPGPSPLDDLERKLEREEREARTGVETARAAAGAESGTEVASLLETLTKDRQGLDQAITAASARLSDADRRAGEAAEKATRLEAENREAAARWVREQAAEIEADATVAAEMGGTPTATPAADDARLKELEGEIETLRSQLEEERREKARAIETAEGRVREIEARAVAVETDTRAEAAGPGAAELREAAVGWLRGQIVALRREIESAEGKGRDES